MKRLFAYICVCVLSSAALSAQDRSALSFAEAFEEKKSFVAISTNALYDAALVPNVGLDFNIYDNWTIHLNGMWSWWTVQDVNWFWRIYGGEVGVRKYFGRQSERRNFTGHHAGIYGQTLSYDLEAGNFGRMAPKLTYGGGLEYGYSFPVANSLNIDFSIGLGVLAGQFYEYTVDEGHYVWRATIQQMWIGPTKAEISLVWLLGS